MFWKIYDVTVVSKMKLGLGNTYEFLLSAKSVVESNQTQI